MRGFVVGGQKCRGRGKMVELQREDEVSFERALQRSPVMGPVSSHEYFVLELPGIGNPLTIPKLIFLSETFCTEDDVTGFKRQVGWRNALAVSCRFVEKRKGKGVSRAGGLCLLWNEDLKVSLQSFSDHHHIDVVVGDANDLKRFRFTGIRLLQG